MSDDEDFDMVEEEDEEDEEEEEEDGPENKYYTAKSLSVNEALEEFTQLSLLNNDWSFKSLKQAAKLSFKSSLFQKAVDFYTKLILLIPRLSLQKNYIEKSINNYLDLVSSSDNVDFLVEIYKVTLASLDQNDRLFHKTHLKLAKLWLDKKNYSRLLESTSLLHNSCNSADGSLDAKKGTLLLEVYALEIQMYTETNDTKRLKEIYNKCINVTSAISHPKIMAVIRECGGKMHMQQFEWNKAQTDFFEAFKNYDEAGSESRIKVLQYLVIANMLSLSSINPFDSQETKPYKQDAAIISLTKLVDAFQARDLVSFNSVLKKMNNDEFIERYIPRVLKLIQKRVLVDIVKPYTRVKLEFVALKLSVQVDYVEELVVELVLDGDIKGRMDMVERILILDRGEKDEFFVGLGQWGDNLEQMMRKIAVN